MSFGAHWPQGALGALACLRDVGAAGGGCGVANGLGSAHGVAVSPDNQNVYVTGQSDNALVVFKGPSTGPGPGPGPAPGPAPVPNPLCSDPTVILVSCARPDPRTVVCVGLWVGSCAGLTPPSPVQTCVSLWQSCTGFGGIKPANPGQIDLSGFPAAVTTRVGCDENARNPFTRPRASASQTSPTGLRDDIECLIKVHWEGTDPNSDARVDYQINVERFNAEVDAVSSEEKQGVFLGCVGITLCDARATATLPLVLSNLLDNIFAAAKQPGKPVPVRGTYIDLQVIDRICAGGTAIPPGRSDLKPTPEGCRTLFTTLDESIKAGMTFLRDRKKKLGVDRPFTASRHRLAARTAARRSRLIVFAAGQARLRQGRVGTLRIAIPSKVRTLLRKAKRRGRRTISVTAVTRATIVPGVTSTRRVKIVLRLTRVAKPRR